MTNSRTGSEWAESSSARYGAALDVERHRFGCYSLPRDGSRSSTRHGGDNPRTPSDERFAQVASLRDSRQPATMSRAMREAGRRNERMRLWLNADGPLGEATDGLAVE